MCKVVKHEHISTLNNKKLMKAYYAIYKYCNTVLTINIIAVTHY